MFGRTNATVAAGIHDAAITASVQASRIHVMVGVCVFRWSQL